jgi:hypothetical protein
MPHHEADAEDRKRQQDRNDRITGGKEQFRDRADKISVDGKVEPFEHIADRAGNDRCAPTTWVDRYF